MNNHPEAWAKIERYDQATTLSISNVFLPFAKAFINWAARIDLGDHRDFGPSLYKQFALKTFGGCTKRELKRLCMEFLFRRQFDEYGDQSWAFNGENIKSLLRDRDSAFAAFGKVAAGSLKPEKPRLRVSQLEEHKRVCDEIALELELWRIARYTEFKKSRKNTIVEPSVHMLCLHINNRHADDKKVWKPLSETKIRRNLESALGVKIDIAKIISSHAGKREIKDKTRRGEQIARKFNYYGRDDICLRWAGLSLRNINFAKESEPKINKIAKALKTDLSYRRAVELVCKRWV